MYDDQLTECVRLLTSIEWYTRAVLVWGIALTTIVAVMAIDLRRGK